MDKHDIYNMIIESPCEAEGYARLGEKLTGVNDNQAYLCLENALYYCEDNVQRESIKARMNWLKEKGITVNKLAFVILNYNTRKLIEDCINSIRNNVPKESCEIIIVDNASSDDSVEYLKEQNDIILVVNEENAGFPRGCNQGIELAENNADILLLNSDTIVMPNSIFWLRMGLYERDRIGVAGSMTNSCYWEFGQNIGENERDNEYYMDMAKQVNIPIENPLENKMCISGFCMLFKREALERVGYLDEIYSPGHYEDNDICIRMAIANYEVVLVHNSYIVHLYHQSFKNVEGTGEVISRNAELIKSKFGCDVINAWVHRRENWQSHISEIPSCKRILEINCGFGENLFFQRYTYPNIDYVGVEREPSSFRLRRNAPGVELYNYNDISKVYLEGRKFDLIFLKTNSIKHDEVEKYISFIADTLSENGRGIIEVECSFYYKKWIDKILTGNVTSSLSEVEVTADDIMATLSKYGLVSKKGLCYFADSSWERDEVKRLLEALPEDKCRDAHMRKVELYVGKG